MWLAVAVQGDLIERPPAGLPALVSVHLLRPQLVQADGVGDGFAAGLDGEGVRHVSDREPLAADSAQAHSQLVGVEPGQLGDVVSRLPRVDGCAFRVDFLNVFAEFPE